MYEYVLFYYYRHACNAISGEISKGEHNLELFSIMIDEVFSNDLGGPLY